MTNSSTPYSTAINVASSSIDQLNVLGSNTYVGQTFEALPGYAQSLKLYLGWMPVHMRLLITEVDESSGTIKPGAVLFETAAFKTPDSQTPVLQEYKFALGGLDLVAGTKYAFILDSVTDRAKNTFGERADIGLISALDGDVYTAGERITNAEGPVVSGTRAKVCLSQDTASAGESPLIKVRLPGAVRQRKRNSPFQAGSIALLGTCAFPSFPNRVTPSGSRPMARA